MARNSKQYKKSGAKYSKITNSTKNYNGSTIVNAWNHSKARGLITATVSPYKGSKLYTTKDGKEYQTMVAKVFYHNSGVEKILACSMNTSTRVIGLQDIGMCISPNGSGKTKSGKHVKGYFGTFNK